MQLSAVFELSGLDRLSDLAVGIPERHTLIDKTVHFLHGEGQAVTSVLHYMRLDFHILHSVAGYVEAVVHFPEHGQELLLKQLTVTEITGWKIRHHKTQAVLHSANAVAMRTDQLEHVRILLVRHDAGPCGHLVREMDECEILAGIEAAVRGKAAQSLCDGSIGRSDDALGLSPAHLGIY